MVNNVYVCRFYAIQLNEQSKSSEINCEPLILTMHHPHATNILMVCLTEILPIFQAI